MTLVGTMRYSPPLWIVDSKDSICCQQQKQLMRVFLIQSFLDLVNYRKEEDIVDDEHNINYGNKQLVSYIFVHLHI